MSVKWGVLGTANIARGCTIPGMKKADNCELYAIAGRSAEKAESFKEEFGFEKSYAGYEKLLEDPEVQAVYIPLPNHLHKEWVIKALKAGALVITKNKSGAIVIEKGINTLNNPAANEDDGWKKIRRVKERFEMFDRIDRTLEPLRAKLNNDDDGRATVIAAILRVLDAMVGEHKLLGGGTVILDPDKAPVGDSAWFKIAVDDIDSLERIYLTYQLRFAPAASAA